jgi:hypothetical protein
MRNLAVIMSMAIVLGAVFPAYADTQQSMSGVPAHRPNATMLAKQYKCGGEELQCGGNLAKVCNPKNGKCCCLIVGTYH